MTPFQLYFLSVEATRSVFVPSKVVFTFTITPFLSLENSETFSFLLNHQKSQKGTGRQIASGSIDRINTEVMVLVLT